MNIPYVLAVLIAGMLFGAGLTLSTMVQPEAVLQFLNFNDFGLLLVLGCATGLTMLVYQLAPKAMRRPLLALSFSGRPKQRLQQTVVGAVLFGIVGGIMIYAAIMQRNYTLAVSVGLVSMVSYLLLA